MENISKYLVISILIIGFSACNDDDGINLQSHNDNEMMTEMHLMMDQMEQMTPSNDPDIDFTRMMIMHHEGAIDMANLELEDGDNSEMRTRAQNIINEQQQEIQQLQSILNGLVTDEVDIEFPMEQMSSMEKMDKTADTQLITGDTDNDFATLMILHHQAAIDNSSAYLHHGSNTQLNDIAKMIIEKQTSEINDLANWLVANSR